MEWPYLGDGILEHGQSSPFQARSLEERTRRGSPRMGLLLNQAKQDKPWCGFSPLLLSLLPVTGDGKELWGASGRICGVPSSEPRGSRGINMGISSSPWRSTQYYLHMGRATHTLGAFSRSSYPWGSSSSLSLNGSVRGLSTNHHYERSRRR